MVNRPKICSYTDRCSPVDTRAKVPERCLPVAASMHLGLHQGTCDADQSRHP